jgi:hypothetical protein
MSDTTSGGLAIVRRLLAWSDAIACDENRSPTDRLTELARVSEITVDVIGLAADKATTPRLASVAPAPQLSPPPPPMPPAPSVLDGDDNADNWPMPQVGWTPPPAPSIATDGNFDATAA